MKTKEERCAGALERQKAYNSLSVKQKIAILDSKFGVGQGAKRQRIRLYAQLNEAK